MRLHATHTRSPYAFITAIVVHVFTMLHTYIRSTWIVFMRKVLREISNQFLLRLHNHCREYGTFLYKRLLLPVNCVIADRCVLLFKIRKFRWYFVFRYLFTKIRTVV